IDAAITKLTKKPVQFASLPGGGQEHGMTSAKVKGLFKGNIAKELSGNSNIAIPKGSTLNSVPEKKK
ncbi:MAG: hypothetical protein ACK5B9_09970, partial [Flavobacteriia bacterium]